MPTHAFTEFVARHKHLSREERQRRWNTASPSDQLVWAQRAVASHEAKRNNRRKKGPKKSAPIAQSRPRSAFKRFTDATGKDGRAWRALTAPNKQPYVDAYNKELLAYRG